MSSDYEVEVYFALGTPPVLIGGGSREDVARIYKEAQAINTASETPRGAVISNGLRHVSLELGRIAGVEPVTLEVMALYEGLAMASRQAYLEKINNPDS